MSSTYFLSDTHLGSGRTNVVGLARLLRAIDTSRLYLLGDIVDIEWSNVQPLVFCRQEIECSHMLAQKIKRRDAVYLTGNHESDSFSNMLDELTLGSHREMVIMYGDEKVLLCHGHEYADFYPDSWTEKLIVETLFRVERALKLAGIQGFSVTELVKFTRRFKSAELEFKKQVVERAESLGCTMVICGHIHNAGMELCGEILYVNCGHWTAAGKGSYVCMKPDMVQLLNEEGQELRIFLLHSRSVV